MGDLSCIHEVPIGANPYHEQFDSRLGWNGQVLGMTHGQSFSIGQVQVKGAEWSSVAHFFDIRDFHDRAAA